MLCPPKIDAHIHQIQVFYPYKYFNSEFKSTSWNIATLNFDMIWEPSWQGNVTKNLGIDTNSNHAHEQLGECRNNPKRNILRKSGVDHSTATVRPAKSSNDPCTHHDGFCSFRNKYFVLYELIFLNVGGWLCWSNCNLHPTSHSSNFPQKYFKSFFFLYFPPIFKYLFFDFTSQTQRIIFFVKMSVNTFPFDEDGAPNLQFFWEQPPTM